MNMSIGLLGWSVNNPSGPLRAAYPLAKITVNSASARRNLSPQHLVVGHSPAPSLALRAGSDAESSQCTVRVMRAVCTYG